MKLTKEEQQAIDSQRERFNNLIKSNMQSISNIDKEVNETIELLEENKVVTNFQIFRDEAKKQATDLLDTNIKEHGLSLKDNYIKSKRNIDLLQLEEVIYKLLITSWAELKLLEEIDNASGTGSLSPRFFEVQSNNTKNTVELVAFLRKLVNDISFSYATINEFRKTFGKEDPSKLLNSGGDTDDDILNFSDLIESL